MVGKQILNNIQEVLYPYNLINFYVIKSIIILVIYNLSIFQNFWNRGFTYKKSFKKLPSWSHDYKLMSWNSLTLFDEYLEMGLLIKNNNNLNYRLEINKFT